MRIRPAVAVLLVALLALPLLASGQFRRQSYQRTSTVEYNSHFAFSRVRYRNNSWNHDYPNGDTNFSAILEYITNMRVRLDGTNVFDLDDEGIFENPILYVSEPGFWTTSASQAENLGKYLRKGGFIIFDDFEGDSQWQNMATQMARALPDHHWITLTVDHPIFHSFFDIQKLDIPHPLVKVIPSYRAIFENNDPSRRMMALANYNNDLAEYWEWSAEGLFNPDPTNDAYRLGVNYIVYAMTH